MFGGVPAQEFSVTAQDQRAALCFGSLRNFLESWRDRAQIFSRYSKPAIAVKSRGKSAQPADAVTWDSYQMGYELARGAAPKQAYEILDINLYPTYKDFFRHWYLNPLVAAECWLLARDLGTFVRPAILQPAYGRMALSAPESVHSQMAEGVCKIWPDLTTLLQHDYAYCPVYILPRDGGHQVLVVFDTRHNLPLEETPCASFLYPLL